MEQLASWEISNSRDLAYSLGRAQLSRARASVNAGRIFLRADNLKVLLEFAEDQNEQHEFQGFLKSLGR